MGKRLYVATKFEVSYDSSAGFNWHFNEFKDLLGCLGVATCDTSAELTDGYGDEWECPYDEFEEALEFLKEYKDVIKGSEESDMTIECNGVDVYLADVYNGIISLECGEDYDESVNEVIHMMELYSKQCAKGDGYMHFQAF
jgi:predicted metal-binding protein